MSIDANADGNGLLVPVRDRGHLLINVLNVEGNFRGFFQHGGNGAVLFFGKVNGVFHGFVGDLASDTVDEPNGGEDGWRVGSAVGFGADFEGGEGLALFAKDADYVGAGASAERDEDKLNGAVGGFFFADVDHDGMPGTGGTDVLIGVSPGGGGFNNVTPIGAC